MNILSVTADNFCSYEHLYFDLADKGLCLLSGDTGVGKSTLLDAVAWGLFGVTSKDGSADDIRSWDSVAPTEVQTIVEAPTGVLWVFRERGPKNDLFWLEDGTGPEMRGKDLGDTQRLLEARLGVTAELFMTGSYLTQFSKADSFFVAKAKDRRQVLEKIADQEFAIKLGERTSDARKVAKKDAERLEKELSGVAGKLEVLEAQIADGMVSSTNWGYESVKKIEQLQKKLESFEEESTKELQIAQAKAQEWTLNRDKKINTFRGFIDPSSFDAEMGRIEEELRHQTGCPTCGGPGGYRARDRLNELKQHKNRIIQDKNMYDSLMAQVNPYGALAYNLTCRQNPYGEQLEAAKAETNPYEKALQDAQKALGVAQSKRDTLQASLTETNALIARLTWLYDASFEMRGLLMARVVSQIESATNTLLERHFDAAIRVRFLLEDSDKLEVEILNDGHRCGFKSLSGGERCLLKLCFSLSLMTAAQNKAGVHFDQIFLDEPLAGLDTGLKVKAFGLFQQLESKHSTVLVIEHDEAFKSQFSNTYLVTKNGNGQSEINESKP